MSFLSLTASQRSVDPFKGHYEDGLSIVEIVNGKEQDIDKIVLVGMMMPRDSLVFGGTQRVSKHYYAGSSEPTVQVLGSEEDDITIQGSIDMKYIRGGEFADKESAAVEYQELIDAMRIRGNLVKITLGQWYRYAFISAVKFTHFNLNKVDYEITFLIVGFNQPQNYYLIEDKRTDLISPNKDLTNKLADLMRSQQNAPINFPTNLLDTVNGAISDIAGKITEVTSFVDKALTEGEALVNSAQRGIGLIQNARATISRSQRRLSRITKFALSAIPTALSEAQKTVSVMQNIQHLNTIQGANNDFQMRLREMQLKLRSLISKIPMRKHFVSEGDSLQSLSIKYYGNVDNWTKIMDHNKLTSTVLVKGTVIEIPR